jgi:hypothetical protein
MTINEYINRLPNVGRLTKAERQQLVFGLALNRLTDEVGISLIAYMPDAHRRLAKLLDKAA